MDGIQSRNFYIFGRNIAHSLSPTLHNAGFRMLGLPHIYSIHESKDVDETVVNLVNQPSFGGASVTYPHKLQVGRLLNRITPCAEKMGAVNTIIVQDAGPDKQLLVGDNTDWIGIRKCIERSVSQAQLRSSTALVLGAGGAARAACYAIEDLGMPQLFLVNRTVSKAEEVIASFPGISSRSFGTLEQAAAAREIQRPIQVIVACIPADDLGEALIPHGLFAGGEKGVLVEMAYRPQVTGMMKVAERHGWTTAKGIDVLEEQAYEQFERWTGQSAPVEAMREAMQSKIMAKV